MSVETMLSDRNKLINGIRFYTEAEVADKPYPKLFI